MGLLLYEESFVGQQPFLVFAAYRKDIVSNRCRSRNISKQVVSLKQEKCYRQTVKNVEKCYKIRRKTWKNVTGGLEKFEKNVTIDYRRDIWEVEKC